MSSDARPPSRLKLVALSREVLAGLLRQDGRSALRVEGLPADATIVGVSEHARFSTNDVVLKVWSSEFPEVPDGRCLEYLDLRLSVIHWHETFAHLARIVEGAT